SAACRWSLSGTCGERPSGHSSCPLPDCGAPRGSEWNTSPRLNKPLVPADLLDCLLVLDLPRLGALGEVLEAGARLAVDVLVHVEMLLEYLVDLAADAVILGEDFLDVPGDEQELDHLVDDVIDSLVAHLESAYVRHLALHLIEARMIITAPLEGLAGRLIHALFGREIFLEDGGHVHLRIRNPHRLHLDVAVRHQRCDDVTSDGGDDLRVKLHPSRSFPLRSCEGRPCRTGIRCEQGKTVARDHCAGGGSASIGSGAGASSCSSASSSAAAASNATSSRSRRRVPSPGPASGGALRSSSAPPSAVSTASTSAD